MAKNCAKCIKSIRGIEYAKCSGFCEKSFHLNCCGLSRSNYELITTNSIYVCEECKNSFEHKTLKDIFDANESFSQFTALQQQISQLQKQISVLTETMNIQNERTSTSLRSIEATIAKSCAKADSEQVIHTRQPLTPSSSQQFLAKQRRSDDVRANSTLNPGVLGTNDCEANITISAPSLTPTAPPERLWLYLSGFHPLVSSDDIKNVVMNCLKIEEPFDIIKLVPKDKNPADLTFISYKIGIPPVYKDVAFLSSTWPKGVRFRQFENHSKNLAPPVMFST